MFLMKTWLILWRLQGLTQWSWLISQHDMSWNDDLVEADWPEGVSAPAPGPESLGHAGLDDPGRHRHLLHGRRQGVVQVWRGLEPPVIITTLDVDQPGSHSSNTNSVEITIRTRLMSFFTEEGGGLT